MLSRRRFLERSGMGLGMVGLGAFMGGDAAAASTSMAARKPQFRPRAKRVIHIFLNGGSSQMDTFDPKPALQKYAGKSIPKAMHHKTERPTGAALPSPFKFKKYGQAGIDISEIFADMGAVADELCVVRSMQANVPNHEPSLLLMNCGDSRLARPAMGSWVTYGLGSENENLPGFIVLCPSGLPVGKNNNWRSAFLPGIYQGMHIDTKHTDPSKLIANVKSPIADAKTQRRQLDLLQAMNREHADSRAGEDAFETRLKSFELAYRMQLDATDAFDVRREPKYIHEMYGKGTQARQILIARRLVERGVRYVQVWHGAGQPWDSHEDVEGNHRKLAGQCSKAIAALIADLKQRGMLDDTLVIVGGEFGRTPTVELSRPGAPLKKGLGRDHNHYGFTTVLAGGGTRGGYMHGSTDELGFRAVDKTVHVHDLHATLLYLLGFDHEKLTFRFSGRDFRLTDVHGEIVGDLVG
jgi:hypothetical protein